MASAKRDDVEDALVGLSDTESGLPTLSLATSAHHEELKKLASTRDILLCKLGEALPDPLHRRLLNAYTSTHSTSAKESIEHELACILLEVLDRAD